MKGFQYLFFPRTLPTYPRTGSNDWGPVWFLNQLMIFSTIYAFGFGKGWSPKVKAPTLLGFVGIAAIIGLGHSLMSLFVPNGSFFGLPGFWSNYLSYPIFFFSGALAQRNGWMDDIKQMPRLGIYSLAVIPTIILECLLRLVSSEVWESSNGARAAGIIIQSVLQQGFMQMGWSLAVSVFFMDYVNKKYWCTPFFSKAMYTAYIIQYAFGTLAALKILFLILDSSGNLEYSDELGKYIITNANLIFPGWLLVSSISLLINFPLAYAIRSIPGFDKVL